MISSTVQILFRVLSGIVPQNYLTLLNNFTTKYFQQEHITSDNRGPRTTMKFGSYLERGGFGKIFTAKVDKEMLESIDEVGNFVSEVFSKVCKEVAINVRQVPQQYKLWDAITLMFWNVTSISKVHVDVRDYSWSMVLPFGNYHSGDVFLKYFNVTATIRPGDLYFINLPHVYHSLLTTIKSRKALVFTNHITIIRKFVSNI